MVNYDIFYDFKLAATWGYPQGFMERIYSDEAPSEGMVRGMELAMRFNPKIKWAMEQGAWIFGVDGPVEVMRSYENYSVIPIAEEVRCHVLLLAGEEDHFIPIDLLEPNQDGLVNASSVTTILYDKESGGHEHCQVGASSLWQADMFQWIETLSD